ncbi:MAG TPA: hypothetical protein VFE47_11835 [Tepidisphaeraceae bacterium]|nr:hypothetical protein [Tepidisphaeraceae bacterium]
MTIDADSFQEMLHVPHMSNTDILLACVIGLLVIVFFVQLLLFRRKDGVAALRESFASFQESAARTEEAFRQELAKTLADIGSLREELATRVASLVKSMIPASTVTKSIDVKLEQVRVAVEARIAELQEAAGRKLDEAGENTLGVANAQREEIAAALKEIKESLVVTLDQYTQYLNGVITNQLHENAGRIDHSLTENANTQRTQIAGIVKQLSEMIEAAEQKLESYRQETDLRLKRIQAENAVVAKFSMATRAFGATLASEFDPAADMNGRMETPPSRSTGAETNRS